MDTNLEFLLEELRTRSGVIWGDFSGNPNENPTPVTENAPNDITWLVETSTATPSIWLKGGGSWIVIGTDLSSSIAAAQQALADTVVAKDATLSAKTAAESARDAAFINADVYASTATGLAAVADGEQFQVVSGSEIIRYTRTNSTTATEVARYPTSTSLLDNVVKTPAILRLAVTPERASFISAGKNKFNKDTATIGKYITPAGVIIDNATYDVSDYIEVVPAQTYTSNFAMRYSCYYDANLNVIAGGISSDATTFTVPVGVTFVRVTFAHIRLAAFQLEVGATATAYEAFRWVNELTSPVDDGSIDSDALAAQAVTPEKASFFDASRNLFDKAAATLGYYLSKTGSLAASASYEVSDYIPITPGQTYSLSPSSAVRFTCYFNAAKGVVAGGSSTPDVPLFTAPVGSAFIRITIQQASHGGFQCELGDKTNYAPFGSTLKPEMLPVPNVLVMPPAIYGVQARECNVYLDNLHIDDADCYLHEVNSSSSTGAQQAERWTWTPSAALSSGSLSVSAHHKQPGEALVYASANQRAAASTAGSGLTKKVIVIGDSLINAAVITQTLLDIAATDVMGVTLLGTRGAGSNKHEGRPGWSITSYTTNFSDASGANPFWIGGVVNFPQYLTDNSIAVPDWVAIHLGINDVFAQGTDAGALSAAATAFTSLDTLITSIKAAGAGVNVALMLPTPPARNQDAFGASYGTGQTRWRFKRNILLWARALITRYAGQEASRIYIAPTNTALDTVNNVSYGTASPVNSRSAVMVARQNNGVHPADAGYQQIGDALWAFLKYHA